MGDGDGEGLGGWDERGEIGLGTCGSEGWGGGFEREGDGNAMIYEIGINWGGLEDDGQERWGDVGLGLMRDDGLMGFDEIGILDGEIGKEMDGGYRRLRADEMIEMDPDDEMDG
ncbi:hypothetical protein Tco_0016904 [Tanacetum coccineum]